MPVREIEISTLPKRVFAENKNRVLYAVINESSVDVYLGYDSGVTTSGESKGIKISANGGYYIDPAWKGEVWLVAPSNTVVTILEITAKEPLEKPIFNTPLYGLPPSAVSKMQVYDGTNWINLSGDSEGRVKVHPYTFEAGPVTLTSTGPSAEVDTEVGALYWTWVQTNDASSTAPDIRLQGSIDGTNWFDLDQSTAIGGEMRHVVNKAVRYVRAYVQSMGDASSITVQIFGIR